MLDQPGCVRWRSDQLPDRRARRRRRRWTGANLDQQMRQLQHREIRFKTIQLARNLHLVTTGQCSGCDAQADPQLILPSIQLPRRQRPHGPRPKAHFQRTVLLELHRTLTQGEKPPDHVHGAGPRAGEIATAPVFDEFAPGGIDVLGDAPAPEAQHGIDGRIAAPQCWFQRQHAEGMQLPGQIAQGTHRILAVPGDQHVPDHRLQLPLDRLHRRLVDRTDELELLRHLDQHRQCIQIVTLILDEHDQ